MMVTTVDRIQMIWDMIGGEEMVDALIKGQAKLEVKLIKVVDWRGITTTLATTENFFVKEKFYKNSKEVKFYRSWENFTNWFLAGNSKTEEPLGEQVLRYGNLTKNLPDKFIIEELGGEEKAETTLTELYDLLKKQANGENGVLLTNGHANIFYIRDTSDILRVVILGWCDKGWCVDASSVKHSSAWIAGHRVIFRNY